MKYLIISCSLKEFSRSRAMAKRAETRLKDKGVELEFIDMNEYPLPFCNAGDCYSDPDVQKLQQLITDCDGILVACPIYNFTINSVYKNLVELTGRAWQDKVVGFLNAAGGKSSYMSVMSIANSLMLDFRSVILPRFVYASEGDFDGVELSNDAIDERLSDLCDDLIRFTQALRSEKPQ